MRRSMTYDQGTEMRHHKRLTQNTGADVYFAHPRAPAAMTVSLLVGTVRTLAHYTHGPGEILTAMNHRMMARSHGGFTTCPARRIDPDGTLTIANAGHLAPYVNATELEIENGLPLDLSESTTYPETTHRLESGKTVTLITDSVVEARARNSELFGFERAASIAVLSTEHIANTALAFGQQDDITVVAIAREAVAEEFQVPTAIS